ncbi:MAG: hypothetical protein J4F37_12435 [Acidobacteria bacterium]|nr:hypothetical protein [Acidobacteriota bacterium]
MRRQKLLLGGSMITAMLVAAAVSAVITSSMTGAAGQATGEGVPRTTDGRPDFSGIWQANNEAHWDLQAHAARPGMVTQPGPYGFGFDEVPAAPVLALGAAGGVPGSLGVVEGDGQIPYTPEAQAIKDENAANWIDRDPELKCYLPGIPRAMYMPYPFQIVQSTNKIQMAFEFTSTARTIHLDEVEPPPDWTYMGHSVGRWEGDTLVVDVTDFNGKNWFDRAGPAPRGAVHAALGRRHPLRGDDHRPEHLHGALEHLHAAVPPPGAEHAAPGVPLHRVRGGVPVRARAEGAAGDALGGRDDHRGHHAEGAARRRLLRLVPQVTVETSG